MFKNGFSMIEMMIVVGIMGILAAVTLPNMVGINIAHKKTAEDARLQAIGSAIHSYAKEKLIIPGVTTWASAVSLYTNDSGSTVLNTDTGTTRAYVYPDNFITTGVTLPYNQDTAATNATVTTVMPINPRIMVISGIRKAVPQASGVLTAAVFDAIWNQTGQPAGLTESADLRIERVNLADIFRKVVMDNTDTVNVAGYKFNGLPAIPTTIPVLTSVTKYVINGTPVQLYDNNSALLLSPYANSNLYYYFNNGWFTTIGGSGGAGGTGGTGGTGGAGGVGGLFQNQPATGSGTLKSWAPKTGCTPSATPYTLTINNNSASDMNVFAGVNGAMTFLKKVKRGRTWTGSVNKCDLVTITPQDTNPSGLHIFYMTNNPTVINVI